MYISKSRENSQGTCEVIFGANQEIISLFPMAAIPRGALNTYSPSVANPPSAIHTLVGVPAEDIDIGVSQYQRLFNAIKNGGHFLSLSPLSDMHSIGLVSAQELGNFAFDEYYDPSKVIWLSQEPKFIESPITDPVLIPLRVPSFILPHKLSFGQFHFNF